MQNSFREKLLQAISQEVTGEKRPFFIGAEVVTSRGVPNLEQCPPFDLARAMLTDSRIDWISITDNPGGNPMLPPDWLAGRLAEYAPRIVLHLACKDYNRISMESSLWRYAAEGFENILALSGDLPTGGYPKFGTGVFDIDSVALIDMIASMNRGLQIPSRRGDLETLTPTNFFIGCAVSPFKRNENELVPQYYKLERKIRAGAGWVLPQLGYDMRKFHEIKQFLASRQLEVPLIGNIYVLTKTVAKMFHSGKLAGCVVSDALLAEVEKYAAGPDKGKSYFREFAAKQLAVFKGLGFAAGYLGGIAKPESFFEIIETANQFAEDDWKTFYRELQFPVQDEFYYFRDDFSDERNQALEKPRKTRNVNLFYRFSRLAHAVAFDRGHGLYSMMKGCCRVLEKKNAFCRSLYGLLHWVEKDVKHTMYGCTDCGDCGLPDTAYLCPMNSCSKNMRNGPCGGSNKGRCEADDKDCIWTIAYDRLKYFKEFEEFANTPVITYDATLKGTSAWANLYMDRDHSAPAK